MAFNSLGSMKTHCPGQNMMGVVKLMIPDATMGSIKSYTAYLDSLNTIPELNQVFSRKRRQIEAWDQFAGVQPGISNLPEAMATETPMFFGSTTQTKPYPTMARRPNTKVSIDMLEGQPLTFKKTKRSYEL